MKPLLAIGIIFLFADCCAVTAQPDYGKYENTDLIYPGKHLSFYVMAGVGHRAKVSPGYPAYQAGAVPQIAFEFGFEQHYSISKRFSLNGGLHAVGAVRNFQYRIPGTEFNPPFDSEVFSNKGVSQEVYFLVKVPVSGEFRWRHRGNSFLTTNAGLSLVYSFLNEETEAHFTQLNNGQLVQYLYLDLIPNNNRRPWLNYHAGIGYGRILKNRNILNINLLLNLSFTKFVSGIYRFTIPGKPVVEGAYSFRGSYTGIGVNYTLTKARKKMRLLNKVKRRD